MVARARIRSYDKESLLAIPCHVVECFALPNELLTLYVLAPSSDLYAESARYTHLRTILSVLAKNGFKIQSNRIFVI